MTTLALLLAAAAHAQIANPQFTVQSTGTLSAQTTGFNNAATTSTLGNQTTGFVAPPFQSPGAPFGQPLAPQGFSVPAGNFNTPGAPFNQPPGTTPPAVQPGTPFPNQTPGTSAPPIQTPGTTPPATNSPGTTPPGAQPSAQPGGQPPAGTPRDQALRRLDESNVRRRKILADQFKRRRKELVESEEWIGLARSERKAKLKALEKEFAAKGEAVKKDYLSRRARILASGRASDHREASLGR